MSEHRVGRVRGVPIVWSCELVGDRLRVRGEIQWRGWILTDDVFLARDVVTRVTRPEVVIQHAVGEISRSLRSVVYNWRGS